MIVKNEDIFIWYAIASILRYAEKILIFDTGSTDSTVKIIQSFNSPKIIFEQKGSINPRELTLLRQEQVDRTKTDWFWVVDGDEIYPEATCREIQNFIQTKGNRYEGGAVRRYDLLGDIYHYQSEEIGQYQLFGQKGHLVLRLINKSKLPDLHLLGKYPNEGYYDGSGVPIIEHPIDKFFVTENRLYHAMYLQRSSKGGNLTDTLHRNKVKIEKGYSFNNQENLPEIFFQKKPVYIPSVLNRRDKTYEIKAAIITPIKKIKRKIWKMIT